MAINVASLTASLGLDSSQFQSGLNSASGSLSKFSSSAQGHASSVGGAFEGISARAVALGGVVANAVTGAIGALGGAFASLQQGMIGGNAEFERYEIQFGVLLKSADKAKERLGELAKFGAETPFELPEVVRADKILQAFGLHSAESAKKFGMSGAQIRTVAGDVAAGTGAKFEEISAYLGKFSSGATGEAIARMQELGITTRAELAGMGVAFSKSGEMTSPVEVGMSALLQVMQTKFGGMMQAQSSTFEGMMSNLQDWVGQAQRILGGPIFDALKGQLSGLLQALGSGQVQAALQSIGTSIGTAFSALGPAIQAATANIGPALSSIASAIQGAITSIQSVIQGFQAAGIGGGTFNLLTALGLSPDLANTIATTIQTIVSAVQGGITTLQTAIQSAQQGLAAGPGVAAINLLTALGLDEGAAAQIGVAVANISAAIQNGIATIRAVMSAFQTGGVAGGASALLQSLGLDPAIVGAAQALFALLGSAIQSGVNTVKAAIAGFQSGGVTGLLAAIGVDPATVSQVTSTFSAIQSTVSSALTTIGGIIGGIAGFIVSNWQAIAVAVGTAAAAFGVLNVVVPIVGAIAGAIGLLLSPIGLIAVAVGALAAAWVSNFGNIQGIVAAVLPILSTLAGIVGGVLVTAFNVVGAVAGFVAQNWQVFAAAAGAVAAVLVGGGIIGAITTITSAIGGLGIIIASAGGVMGTLSTVMGVVAGAFALPLSPILILVGAVAALAVAWQTNMGDIQGKTSVYIQQIIANWQQLVGYVGAIGQFLQTPISQMGQGFSTLQERIGQVNADFQANLGQIASSTATAAASATTNFGEMGQSASVTGQIVKAVMAGDFGAIPGIVNAAIGGANQAWAGGLNQMVGNTQQAAFSVRSLMASIMGMSQQASMAAAQNSAAPTDPSTERALTRMEAMGKTIDKVKQVAAVNVGKAAEVGKIAAQIPAALGGGAAGGGGKGNEGLKSVEDKIQAAAETISKVTDTAMKLKEALSNGLAGLMSGEGADTIVSAAAAIAQLGRRMYEEFSKAAQGMSEDADKASQALSQGISSAASGLGATVGLLSKLWEFLQSDAWGEMQGHMDEVVAAAAQLSQIGRQIYDAFSAAAAGVSEESAKTAQAFGQGLQAAASGLSAMVQLLPKLWEFINDPAWDEIKAAQGAVVRAAGQIARLGRRIFEAFMGAAGGISEETAKAAQAASQGIQAATQSISAIIDTVKRIVDFISDAGYAAAILTAQGRASVIRAASALISLGMVMFDMFVNAAGNISTKASLSAKRLGEGLQAMGQGLASVIDSVTKITSFMHDGMNVIHVVSSQSRGAIVTMVSYLTTLGQMMLDQFAQVGASVSGLAVAAAKRLAEGLQAAGQGIASIIDAITKLTAFMHDGMNVIHTTTALARTNLIAAVGYIVTLGRAVYDQFVTASQLVSQYHVDAAKRLSEGLKAAADAILSVLALVTQVTSFMHQAANVAAVAPGRARDALLAVTNNLADMARAIYDQWVRASVLVSQYHVDAAKRLGEGVSAAVSAITATLDLAIKLIDTMANRAYAAALWWPQSRNALLAVTNDLAGMAREIYNQWVSASVLVSEYHVEAAKRLADGVSAAVSAVTQAMDLIVKLLDFASNAVYRTIAQSQGARAYFAALATDIMKLGAAIIAGFTQAALDVGQPVVDSTKRFADAVSNLSNGLTSTITIVNTLVSLLRNGMPEVNADDLAQRFVGPLVTLGVKLSVAANTAAQSLTGLNTAGLDKLKNVIGGLLDMFKGITDLIEYVLGGAIPAALARVQATINQIQNTLANVGVSLTVTPDQMFHAILDPILALGITLTRIIAEGTQALGGLDTSGYEKLASVMGNAQDTIKKIVDLSDFILDLFTNGGLFDAATRIQAILAELNARLAGMGQGPTNIKELLRQMLAPILALGVALAEVAAEATASLANLETGGLSKLNDAIGGLQTALESIPKLIKQILTDWQQGWPDINPEQAAALVITPLLNLGMALARAAATAAASLSTLQTDGLSRLNDAVGGLQTALETIPKLLRQILTTWQQGWPDLDPEQAAQLVIGPLFRLGIALAQAAETAAAGMASVTTDAVKALGDAVGLVLSALKNTLDLFKLLTTALAGGPLDMTGAGLHPEFVDALVTYAVGVAESFLAAAGAFDGVVTDASKALGDALNAALGTAKNALEILALFSKTLAGGPVDMTTADLHPELIDALATYAVDLATAFLAVANAFRGEVTDGAKQLGDALNAAMGTTKNALEILALFTKTLASGPLDMMTAGLHPELIDALTTYAVGLATAFLAVANTFDGVVTDGAKALGDALNAAMSTAKNALELLALFGKTLTGGPLDMTTAGLHPELIDALTAYAISLAESFLAAANSFDGVVSDGAKQLGDALNAALSTVKNALEALTLFNDTLKNGPLDMTGAGIHPELVDALTTYAVGIAAAFLDVANTFRGEVTDGAKALGEAMGGALGVIKDVLEFNDLRAAIVSFKPLDMAVYGPKLDLIFAAVKEVAQRFVEKAKTANISQAMQEAADALSKVFGDAAGSIKGALDMAASLLDPQTQIPSIGQIQGKLDAVLNLVEAVTRQFAARAAAIGPDTAKSAEGLSNAVKSVFDAISQVIAAVQDAADLYLGTAGFNNIAALMSYLFGIFDQFAGQSESVNAVTAAITSLLGGIQALVSSAGFTAGQTWGQQFAAGLAAVAGGVTAAAGGAIAATGAGGGSGGGGGSVVNNITYNQQKTLSVTVNNSNGDAARANWGGLYGLATGF